MRRLSGPGAAAVALEWTTWSFPQKVWHAFRKYNGLLATFHPSVQFSCSQKALFFDVSFLGGIFAQALFFSGGAGDEDNQCAERKKNMTERERLLMVVGVSILSSCAAGALLNKLHKIMHKPLVHAKGWDTHRRRQLLLHWRHKEKAIEFCLWCYAGFVLLYLFLFLLKKESATTTFVQTLALSALVKLFFLPLGIAVMVAFILQMAQRPGEQDCFDQLLVKAPHFADFTHEHHDKLGGRNGRLQIWQLLSKQESASTTTPKPSGLMGALLGHEEPPPKEEARHSSTSAATAKPSSILWPPQTPKETPAQQGRSRPEGQGRSNGHAAGMGRGTVPEVCFEAAHSFEGLCCTVHQSVSVRPPG